MAISKKYSYKIEQKDDLWMAQIIRKASSKTLIVSKEKDAFASEAEAKEWAEQQLSEFATSLSSSNKRHGEQRKQGEEVRRQRSIRRSEKKQLEKQAKAEAELAEESSTEEDS